MEIQRRLPEEIWNMIFKYPYLQEPKDLLSVMRTCTGWEAVLQTKKSLILFQNVLPLIAKYLPNKNLLSCRGISKHIKGTIDTLLEVSFPLRDYYDYEYQWRHPSPIQLGIIHDLRITYNFWNPSTLPPSQSKCLLFLEKFKGHKDNPFVGGQAIVPFVVHRANDIRASYQQCYNNALPLLTQFGGHLRTFTHSLRWTEDFLGANQIPLVFTAFTDLQSILSCLTNLKTLRISWDLDTWAHPTDRIKPKDECPFLLRFILLPVMRKLTCLQYDYRGGYVVSLGLHLLSGYGHQLTTFTCSGDAFFDKDRIHVQNINVLLFNLKNLRISHVTPVTLRKLSLISLRLETLQLQSYSESLTGMDLVNAINSFSESLTQLQIDFYIDLNKLDMEKGKEFSVELGKLKQLSVNISNTDYSLFWEMIVVKCKNIKMLDFQTPKFRNALLVREIVSGSHKMAKRFVRRFAKLERIRICIDHYEPALGPLILNVRKERLMNEN